MADDQALPAPFATMIFSFRLSLKAERAAVKTVALYEDAAARFARWIVRQGLAATFAGVERKHIRLYMVWLQENAKGCWCGKPRTHAEYECPKGRPISPGYANNQYRGIQQFFKWHSIEEELPNPMVGLKPPKLDKDKVIPVIPDADLAAVIKQCEKGRDFVSRRDHALLRFFACTGCRLSEVTAMEVQHVNLELYEALVTGKGGKQRVVKFDAKCAQAINRYLNVRALQKAEKSKRLWLSTKNAPLTPNGLRQMVERRGIKVDLDVFPHMFRHTFSHKWLDAGGAEGDLMELNGWESPQMLRHYGRSAKSARARRAYDRINVMGDI
jgi:site-specific recombinase XerD